MKISANIYIYTSILDWKSALPALLLNTVLIYTMSGISRDINNIHQEYSACFPEIFRN